MHDMVVIGKADQLPVRAEDMYVAATAQRARSIGRGDIHRIQIAYLTVMRNHPGDDENRSASPHPGVSDRG